MSGLITEQEKDRLLAERQQMIEALLNYINNLLRERFDAGDSKALSIKDLSEYISEGGDVSTHRIDVLKSERAMELFDFFKVNYVALSRHENEQGADYIDFVTRDDEAEKVGKAMETLEFERNTHLCWIGVEDFLRQCVGDCVDRFTIPQDKTSDLTQELNDSAMLFSINFLMNGKADVYFRHEDRQQMTECAIRALERSDISEDIRISEHKIDSVYTAQEMAGDKDRSERQHNKHKRHLNFGGLAH